MKGYIKCRRCNHIVFRPEGMDECPVCGSSRHLEKSSKTKMENHLTKGKKVEND